MDNCSTKRWDLFLLQNSILFFLFGVVLSSTWLFCFVFLGDFLLLKTWWTVTFLRVSRVWGKVFIEKNRIYSTSEGRCYFNLLVLQFAFTKLQSAVLFLCLSLWTTRSLLSVLWNVEGIVEELCVSVGESVDEDVVWSWDGSRDTGRDRGRRLRGEDDARSTIGRASCARRASGQVHAISWWGVKTPWFLGIWTGRMLIFFSLTCSGWFCDNFEPRFVYSAVQFTFGWSWKLANSLAVVRYVLLASSSSWSVKSSREKNLRRFEVASLGWWYQH